MAKINVKNVVLPHSQAKLDLYRDYLNEYLPVLINSKFVEKINIYDVFCGAGIYDDGKPGSPLIAARCINENIVLFESKGVEPTPISLTVNDLDIDKSQFVGQLLEDLEDENFTTRSFNLTAGKMFQFVKEETNTFPKKHRNLAFVDPYGYSDITKDNLEGLISNRRTEVILFLPVSNLYRFSEIAKNDVDSKCYDHLRRFIFEFFPENSKIRSSNADNIYDYINEIRLAFSFNDTFYSSSYYIKRDHVNHYALFFIGPHIYGLEKFLQAKWKNDSLGQGFNIKYSMPSLFESELQEVDTFNTKTKLEAILKLHIKENPYINNTDLYVFILKNQFLPKDAVSILTNWKKDSLLTIYNESLDLLPDTRHFFLTYTNFKEKTNVLKLKFK
ncbi:three-Cys-motif partner protein [Pedobacter sp. W3I1]|uniref:three-Cys-motif partner protein TcmP n=1 Tax=Pedobacter sp. W3I1 TaxID=3042291 RepID=UPI00277F1600|nr:three-Cys-motif partner protein TcmP [Pedobacter sp. W3I1]MDQ0639288.1 three-Cys-motif partner protein [Pedobacter sp. W3I1]